MFGRYRLIICLILYGAGLFACPLCTVREAQQTVRMADSVWAAGRMYNDSVSLAQAYHTLHTWRAVYPDEYVHSCYHYGRLLREQDDPVSAMQTFISATHSRSRDYRILGRVYSNMGDIAHLAGEFELSYDMFARSANLFLQSGDTLLYYYGLNNMAFERAEQGDSILTYDLLRTIRAYPNRALWLKSVETEAALYQTMRNHEVVIALVDSIQICGNTDILGDIMKARAFYYLENSDSARFYSNRVINKSPNAAASIAAYYILSHDRSFTVDSILFFSSERADVQKLWAYSHGRLSLASQLLKQDLASKSDWSWLYTLLAIVFFIPTIVVLVFLWRKRSQHQQIIQEIQVKEQKKMQLANVIDTLSNIQEERHCQIRADIEEACRVIRNNEDIKVQLHWNDYDRMCKIVNARFYGIVDKLQTYPTMTENDIRMCILVLLDISYEKIAYILNLSPKSIAKLKSITAHKLGTTMKNLRDKLMQIACQIVE